MRGGGGEDSSSLGGGGGGERLLRGGGGEGSSGQVPQAARHSSSRTEMSLSVQSPAQRPKLAHFSQLSFWSRQGSPVQGWGQGQGEQGLQGGGRGFKAPARVEHWCTVLGTRWTYQGRDICTMQPRALLESDLIRRVPRATRLTGRRRRRRGRGRRGRAGWAGVGAASLARLAAHHVGDRLAAVGPPGSAVATLGPVAVGTGGRGFSDSAASLRVWTRTLGLSAKNND